MKKIIISLVCLLLVGLATAITLFDNREEAFSYFTQEKTQREADIQKATLGITYTTDKICEIDYESEESICKVCFEFTYLERTIDDCIYLDEYSTLEEDDLIIKEIVLKNIDADFPMEKVEYIADKRIGKKIPIKEVK